MKKKGASQVYSAVQTAFYGLLTFNTLVRVWEIKIK